MMHPEGMELTNWAARGTRANAQTRSMQVLGLISANILAEQVSHIFCAVYSRSSRQPSSNPRAPDST